MGKAKHFKQIRKFAAKLPVIMTTVPIGETVYGAELLGEGVKDVNGKPVHIKHEYRRIRYVKKAVNHYRQMKRYFYEHGAQGVKAYVIAVQRYESARRVKAERQAA